MISAKDVFNCSALESLEAAERALGQSYSMGNYTASPCCGKTRRDPPATQERDLI